MKKRYKEVDLIDFQKIFKTEKQCEKRLFIFIWPSGFKCPKCRYTRCFNLPRRKLFQRKRCAYQVSLTAGTIIHRTRTPLLKSFWAIYLVSTDKRGLSAVTLSKRLKISYWVAWTIFQKIRKALNDRNYHYKLQGKNEMDDFFWGVKNQETREEVEVLNLPLL